MKKVYSVILLLLSVGSVYSQSENRVVTDFQVLNVSNTLEIVLTQGETNKVTIEGAAPEDIEKVKTEVKDGKLSVFTKGKVKSKANIKVLITVKNLKRIEQSGASEISTTNTLKADDFSIKGSGAIEADLDLEVDKLSINFSGASDIKLTGSAKKFDLVLSGASDLKASNFKAKHVEVNISGASDVKVYASKSITGRASGASSIHVKGNPLVRKIDSSFASSSSYNDADTNKPKPILTIHLDDDDFLFGDDSTHVHKPKKRRNHWAGLDLGINGFLNSNGSSDLSNDPSLELTDPEKVTQFMELNYRKSWTFSINFMEFYIPIKSHYFGLVTGMGTEWNNYELKHNIRLNAEGGRFVHQTVDEFNKDYTWGEVDTVLNYSKNRFKTWFINVPLLLELNTGKNKNKSFHISAGAILGFNLQTKIKYKYRLDGDSEIEKDKQSFNTNPFRVSLTARGGIGWFNVFATYSLTPLFEDGRGPELYPFTVGITLLGF